MIPNTGKHFFSKLLALFAVIRGYNVAVLMLAMYITSYFIFAKDTTLFIFLSNIQLHLIIAATGLTISAGYIINNFYDLDKDTIARPITTYISRFISQNFKLNVYLILSLLAIVIAFAASWRVGLFFIVYNFMVWLYSHKLSRLTLIHNLSYVVLSLMPFIALLLFFNNHSPIIFYHGIYLAVILLIMDIVKDFTTYRADLIFNYKTLPVSFGIKNTKYALSFVITLSFAWTLVMSTFKEVGHMKFYFQFTAIFILAILVMIWLFKDKWQYHILFILIKLLLGIGIISIAWIKINPLDLQKFFPID